MSEGSKGPAPQETIWPRFVAMEDLGSQLRFRLQQADGSEAEVLVWKRFKLNQPDLYDGDLTSPVVERGFDLASSRSLVFELGGGVGDFIIAVQAILSLRDVLKSTGKAGFEFIGVLAGESPGFIHRFLEVVPVLDRVVRQEDVATLTTRYRPVQLDARPYLFRAGDLTVGNVWDHLWWKWGVPGRYQPAQAGTALEGLKRVASAEIRDLRRQRPEFPQSGRYVLLADDATMLARKKAWPAAHWTSLMEWVLRETRLHLVVMTTAERSAALPRDPRIFPYDFRKIAAEGITTDLLRLGSVVEGARAVVSVDSGVAHVAGLLGKPCITLWGPTRPVTHGQPANINLRLSSCPPCCSDAFRQAVCRRFVCMEENPANAVINVLGKLLRNPGDTRKTYGALG